MNVLFLGGGRLACFPLSQGLVVCRSSLEKKNKVMRFIQDAISDHNIKTFWKAPFKSAREFEINHSGCKALDSAVAKTIPLVRPPWLLLWGCDLMEPDIPKFLV